jgi:prepilin-type N-terminal cleavage/methylation domain-containing protein
MSKPRCRSQSNRHAFTLVELLATIAIVAILVTAGTFFTASYIQWAQNTADQRTLLVLNDALTRYKCEGGNINALTAGAQIGNVISALQTSVSWAGTTHQFMQKGVTYPARSLSAAGNGPNYYFYQYNTYTSGTPSASTPTNTYPYGQGNGYISNNGASIGLAIYGSGYGAVAFKDNNGNITYETGTMPTLSPAASSYTFWSCVGNGDPTPSGAIGSFGIGGSLNSLNVSGLTALWQLLCSNAGLTSLNISGCTALTQLQCSNNQLTSLNLSGCTALTQISCSNNQLPSLPGLSACTGLQSLDCGTNQLTTLNVSGFTALTSLICWSNNLTYLNVSGCPVLTTLYCCSNHLPANSGLIITGDFALAAEGQCTPSWWHTPFYTDGGVVPVGP